MVLLPQLLEGVQLLDLDVVETQSGIGVFIRYDLSVSGMLNISLILSLDRAKRNPGVVVYVVIPMVVKHPNYG